MSLSNRTSDNDNSGELARQMESVKDLFNKYVDHCIDHIDNGSKLIKELKFIKDGFNKHEEDGLRNYLYKLFDSDDIFKGLISMNNMVIYNLSVDIPIKGKDKQLKLRIGSLYKRCEEVSQEALKKTTFDELTGDTESEEDVNSSSEVHIDYMINLLILFHELYADSLGQIFNQAKTRYELMKGNFLSSVNISTALECIPGLGGIITSYLPPEFFNKARDLIKNNDLSAMKSDEISTVTGEILDTLPALEEHRSTLNDIIKNVLKEPDVINNFKTNPVGVLSKLVPSNMPSIMKLLSGSGDGTAMQMLMGSVMQSVQMPQSTGKYNQQMNDMMSNNPYQ